MANVFLLLLEQRVEFGVEPVERYGIFAGQLPAIWLDTVEFADFRLIELRHDFDRFPAFGADGFCRSLQILGDWPIEQRGVGEVAIMVGLEQILDDGAAGSDIRIDADEFDLRVVGADVSFDKLRRDRVWLPIPGLPLEPCGFLGVVVVGEGRQ